MGEAKRKRERAVEVLPNGICLERNRPTPEGRKLGQMLADWAEAGEPIARLQFPATQPCCKSCAYRRDTIPNGCPETVLDAVGCVVDNVPFMCHMEFHDDGAPTKLCSGWLFAREAPAAKMTPFLAGRVEMPARSEATKAYLDNERQKASREAPMTKRREFTKPVKVAIIKRATRDGVIRCENCL